MLNQGDRAAAKPLTKVLGMSDLYRTIVRYTILRIKEDILADRISHDCVAVLNLHQPACILQKSPP